MVTDIFFNWVIFLPIGEELCHGHGECVGPNDCLCEENWTGVGCETPLCPDHDECNGRGRCVAPNQ